MSSDSAQTTSSPCYRGHVFEYPVVKDRIPAEVPAAADSHLGACRTVIALAEADAGLAAVTAQHYAAVLLARQLAGQPAADSVLASVGDGARLALLPGSGLADWAWDSNLPGATPTKLSGTGRGTIGALAADWLVAGSGTTPGSLAFVRADADTVRIEPAEPAFGLAGSSLGDVYVDGYPLDRRPRDPGPGAAHRQAVTRLVLHAAFDYGIVRAVLIAGLDYLVTRARAWREAPSARASEDPLVLERAGGYISRAHGLELLLGDLARLADEPPGGPGELETAAVLAGQACRYGCAFAAELSNGLIELLGASSTDRRFHFDRYWRDLCAHCLLNPPASPDR